MIVPYILLCLQYELTDRRFEPPPGQPAVTILALRREWEELEWDRYWQLETARDQLIVDRVHALCQPGDNGVWSVERHRYLDRIEIWTAYSPAVLDPLLPKLKAAAGRFEIVVIRKPYPL